MADFPKLKRGGAVQGDGSMKQDNQEAERKHRVVLSDGAIFPTNWMVKTASEKSEDVDKHHVASIGDIVAMTDAEFDAHQAAGVCVVNAEEREAA